MAEQRITHDAAPVGGRTVPNFGKMYHVKGVISLPYSEITEDFEAWYDLEGNRSRIDYRNGTVQLFDHFKTKFSRQYKSEKVHQERENVFLHILRNVHLTNRAGLSFTVGINQFADRKKMEIAKMTGRLIPR